MDPVERLWIATAPAGVPSSGPSVVYDLGDDWHRKAIDLYKLHGWKVDGPYVLSEEEN